MNTVSRSELVRSSYGTSATPVAGIAKCSVCLSFVALIAWIGAGAGEEAAAAPGVRVSAAGAAGVVVGDRAAAHRRQVFDARRARFDDAAHAQVSIASPRGGHADVATP